MRKISGRFCAVVGLLWLLPGVALWGSNGDGRKPGAATGVSSLPAEAQASISAALGRDLPAYRVRKQEGALTAENAKQRLTAEFSARGVAVHTGNQHWGVAFLGYGYGEALTTARDTAPHANANRVDYRRGPVTEWYVNGPLGLEQGFTLAEPPVRTLQTPKTLTIALSLGGDLTARVDESKTSLTLTGGLRYAGLAARDASGRELHTWMELQGSQLLLRVDDAGAQYPVVVDPIVQLAQLSASDEPFGGGGFGASVAISGNTVVVGMPDKNQDRGAAYVFVEPASGWANMTETARLTASDGTAGYYFGRSVAISGNTVVVGANGATVGRNSNEGAAYVFVEPIGGWVNMTQTGRLTASDGANGTDLATSVAISGNTVVAGAPGAGGGGKAYVFVKPPAGWTAMTQTAELSAEFGQATDGLGTTVAISGNTIAAGLPGWNDPYFTGGQGALDVFVMPPAGWQNMTETAELIASDGEIGDALGLSLAISGGTIVAGAPYATVDFNEYQGTAYVFVMPAGGWVDGYENAKLNVTDGQPAEQLGFSVGISGNTALVGTPIATVGSNEREGAAYVFLKPTTGWASMTQTDKLTDSQGVANESFGYSFGLVNNTVIVGALEATVNGRTQGAAYVFGP